MKDESYIKPYSLFRYRDVWWPQYFGEYLLFCIISLWFASKLYFAFLKLAWLRLLCQTRYIREFSLFIDIYGSVILQWCASEWIVLSVLFWHHDLCNEFTASDIWLVSSLLHRYVNPGCTVPLNTRPAISYRTSSVDKLSCWSYDLHFESEIYLAANSS